MIIFPSSWKIPSLGLWIISVPGQGCSLNLNQKPVVEKIQQSFIPKDVKLGLERILISQLGLGLLGEPESAVTEPEEPGLPPVQGGVFDELWYCYS